MKRSEMLEWTAALRSDEFTQGHGYLNRADKQCCMGVKCILDVRAGRYGITTERPYSSGSTYFGVENWSKASSMPSQQILDAWGMSVSDAYDLAEKNDGMGGGRRWAFAEIADWIEDNLPVEED